MTTAKKNIHPCGNIFFSSLVLVPKKPPMAMLSRSSIKFSLNFIIMKLSEISLQMAKLRKEIGDESSDAILELMDLKASTFEQKLDSINDRLTHQAASLRNISLIIAIVGILIVAATLAGQFISQ